jgi:hypothetical protein
MEKVAQTLTKGSKWPKNEFLVAQVAQQLDFWQIKGQLKFWPFLLNHLRILQIYFFFLANQ